MIKLPQKNFVNNYIKILINNRKIYNDNLRFGKNINKTF